MGDRGGRTPSVSWGWFRFFKHIGHTSRPALSRGILLQSRCAILESRLFPQLYRPGTRFSPASAAGCTAGMSTACMVGEESSPGQVRSGVAVYLVVSFNAVK